MTARSFGVAAAGLAVAALAAGASAAQEGDLSLAVAWMTGSFSSAQQAAADTSYFDVRLEIVPIWPDRADGRWLYVEQAAAGHVERPYRQRVYHVTASEPGKITSEVFTIPQPLRFAGAWRDEAPLAALSPDSLELREGCAVVLRRTEHGFFEGGTVGTGCASSLSGAAYATSEVRLTPRSLTSWDRGFDADGNHVWGAEDGPYVFDRIAGDGGSDAEETDVPEGAAPRDP